MSGTVQPGLVGTEHPIVPASTGQAWLSWHPPPRRGPGDGLTLLMSRTMAVTWMAAADGLLEDGGTDKTAGTDEGNLHGKLSFAVGMGPSYAPDMI